MSTEQNRRIDDIRPAVGLDWDESAAKQARAAFEIPGRWTILLTSSNHGLVGAYGHEFPHATSDHVKVNVVPESVASDLRARIVELESSAAPASADNPSTAGAAKGGITDFERVCLTELCNRIVVAKDEPIAISVEAAGVIRRLLAAPALNPSEVRDQVLEEAAMACEAWGNGKVAKWSDFPDMHEDAKARAWDGLQCAAAIRAMKSAAIKAADQQGALGEKGGDGA